MSQKSFGEFIREIRKKHSLTQRDLANKYHVTYQAVSKWENGKNMPDTALIRKISQDFGVSLEAMFDGEVVKKKVSKKIVFSIILLVVLVSCCVFGFLYYVFNKSDEGYEAFFLDEEYYGSSAFVSLDEDGLSSLIREKKSFVVFIYQPNYSVSSDFEEVLNDFSKTYQVKFYKMSFANMKESYLDGVVKYYPSFIIVRDGEVVDYLDAFSEEDAVHYSSVIGFNKWFTKYVKLKEVDRDAIEIEVEESEVDSEEEVVIEGVSYEASKVNIYLFWGDGCPHCENEHAFFDRIEEEYGQYYNLHTFEVWYNEENKKILDAFAKRMGDEVKGVPYTIIGSESFRGFGEGDEEVIIDAIISQHENSYDVYFDK